jgi:methylglutaconyl-CoA hydratase
MSKLVLTNNENAGISIVTINRPEKRNALSLELIKELTETIQEVSNKTDVRAMILTASENIFSAGLDIVELANSANLEQFSRNLATLLKLIYELPIITIAAVIGGAHGGGGGLVLACDLAIAGSNAKFSFPEVRRGLSANIIMALMQRKLNQRDIAELLFIAEWIDAERALEYKIVNRVVDEENVLDYSLKMAQNILRAAPSALKRSKVLLHSLYPTSLENDIGLGIKSALLTHEDNEYQEGIRSYLEKRDAIWNKVKAQPAKPK